MSSLKSKIGGAVVNADLSQLYKASDEMIKNGVDFLHLDVNDGRFVPSFTFGPPVIKCLRNNLKDAYFEAHMMVTEPDHWIEDMADAGVDRYVFHVEPVPGRIGSICRRIREAGMKAGLALNPSTNVSVIEKYIALADLVLIMTVDFADHQFLIDQMKKVQWLRGRYPNLDIQVDGSVKLDNVDLCAQSGANVIVSGSAICSATGANQKAVISKLRAAVDRVINKHENYHYKNKMYFTSH